MPWSTGPVNDRIKMIGMWQRGESVQELAERFGVTRQCVHKWIVRYTEEDRAGLVERSRAPHQSPNQTSPELIDELLCLKRKHMKWGPVTLVDLMRERHGVRPMAPSTAGEILERYGLVRRKKRRQRGRVPATGPLGEIPGSGHTMTADYKGQFRVGSGRYCYPLTLAEPISRYVFAVEGLSSTRIDDAKRVFERVFREWGVPKQILTDNGIPFCSPRSIGGLSELSKWWIKCGARPFRIEPGKPQQNGRHERMHRTLKEATASPPASSFRTQQRRFNTFREEFNQVRPHQALGGKTPASRVRPFPGTMPRKFVDFEYPVDSLVRRVRSNGQIKWAGTKIFIGEVLIDELIALVELDHGLFAIYFGPVRIGTLDASKHLVY